MYNSVMKFLDTLAFDDYSYLFLLPIPLLLGAWIINHRGHRVVLPLDNVNAKSRRILRGLITTCSLSVVLICAVAIFILASPVEEGIPEKHRKLTNIDVVVDLSHSMLDHAGAGYPDKFTRYDLATQEMVNFCKQRKGDSMGLTFFANDPINWLPLTKDIDAIAQAPKLITPRSLPRNDRGTYIEKALLASAQKLSMHKTKTDADDSSDFDDEDEDSEKANQAILDRENRSNKNLISEGDKMILLITDGESMDMRNNAEKAQAVADKLKKNNIVVYAILISPKNDTVTLELDVITSTTGGVARLAKDPSKLRKIFDEINNMKKATFRQTTSAKQDNYHPFAWAGIFALCIYAIGAFYLRYTPW